MPTYFRWLHLTDLHLGSLGTDQYFPQIEAAFFDDLDRQIEARGQVHLVVLSGDFVDKAGWAGHRARLDEFLGRLAERLGDQAVMVAAPGNHDLTRPKLSVVERAALAHWHDNPELRLEFFNDPANSLRTAVQAACADYVAWWKGVRVPKPSECQPGLLPGEFSTTIRVDGRQIGVVVLNSAFLTVYFEREQLDVDVRQWHGACGGNGPRWCQARDHSLLVTHHPPELLAPRARREFKKEVAVSDCFCAQLCGDLHDPDLRAESSWGGKPWRVWRGASLFGVHEDNRIHGYSLGELDLEGRSLRQVPREATDRPNWAFVAASVAGLTEEGTPWEPLGSGLRPPAPQPQPNRKPLFVHRYGLLDSNRGLIGREAWLTELNRWQSDPEGATVLTVHAIGGSGKSALAWAWFDRLFSTKQTVAGGMWYSFYEPKASFSDFLRQLYDYVLGPRPADSRSGALGAEEFTPLFDRLQDASYVIVLDGFERLLRAYQREQPTRGSGADLAHGAELTPARERDLCKAVDENVNAFLTSLGQRLASRFLITSRLVPAATLNPAGQDRPYARALPLDALVAEEVVGMMKAYGVRGLRADILRVTARFGHHALLVKLIAAMVAEDRATPGDFDAWLRTHPGFEPVTLNVTENRVHVLDYALQQLTPVEGEALLHASALRGAVAYGDLRDLLVGQFEGIASEDILGAALERLNDLELVEWDRARNEYELHPLVRNTVWLRASARSREQVDERIIHEFGAYPLRSVASDSPDLERHKDVFLAMVRRERYDDAWGLYYEKLHPALGEHYSAVTEVIELLSTLLTTEDEQWPRLSAREDRATCLVQLGMSYELSGDNQRALVCYDRHRPLCPAVGCPTHQARVLSACGQCIQAEHILRRILSIYRQHGDWEHGEVAVTRNLAIDMYDRGEQSLEAASRRIAYLIRQAPRAERRDRMHDAVFLRYRLAADRGRRSIPGAVARWAALATRCLAAAETDGDTYHQICAIDELARAQLKLGEVDLSYQTAIRCSELARRAGQTGLLSSTLLHLARIALDRGQLAEAEQLTIQVAEFEERSQVPGQLSQARFLQARIARGRGDANRAAELATDAYRLAWCDGPPFAFSDGLCDAEKLLGELSQPIPTDLLRRPLPPDWVEIDIEPSASPASSNSQPGPAWESASPEEAQQLLYIPDPETGGQCEVDYLLQRSKRAFDDSSFDEAAHWARRAVELDPLGDDCWAARAVAHWYQNDQESAAQYYNEAARLAARSAPGLRQRYLAERGQACVLLGRAEEAIRDLEESGVREANVSSGVTSAYALALYLAGRSSEGEKVIRRATRNDPENARGHFYRARVHDFRENRRAARRAFLRALSATSRNLTPWMEQEARGYAGGNPGSSR